MSRVRYLEDWAVGDELALGRHRVEVEEIRAFAAAFDPQPFHLDEAAGRRSIFGGLVASGWHTCAVMMRLIATTPEVVAGTIASPGCDELAWPTPVRPRDELRGFCRVIEVRPSAGKPDRGLVRFHQWLVNQRGETVLSLKAMAVARRRPTGTARGAEAARAAGGA